MKKVIISLLASLGLVASAAASVYTGASVGYLIDAGDAIISARVGVPLKISESELYERFTHNLELELGYTTNSDQLYNVRVEVDTIPLMINYRAEAQKNGWTPYFGAGIGASVVKGKAKSAWVNYSDRDTVFTGQIFVGVNYNFSEATSLKLGARYIHLAAPTLASLKLDDIDDGVIEAGFTFRF